MSTVSESSLRDKSILKTEEEVRTELFAAAYGLACFLGDFEFRELCSSQGVSSAMTLDLGTLMLVVVNRAAACRVFRATPR